MRTTLLLGLIPGLTAVSLLLPAAFASEQDANLLELCQQQAKLDEVDKEDVAAYIEECLQGAQDVDTDITDQNSAPSKEKEG